MSARKKSQQRGHNQRARRLAEIRNQRHAATGWTPAPAAHRYADIARAEADGAAPCYCGHAIEEHRATALGPGSCTGTVEHLPCTCICYEADDEAFA